jgi:hypothetical protein
MPKFFEEPPAPLANSFQQFGILVTIALTSFVVVALSWLIFGPTEGAP